MFLTNFSRQRKKKKGRKIIDYMGFESLGSAERKKNNNMVGC